MNRRKFIQRTGAITAAAAVSPVLALGETAEKAAGDSSTAKVGQASRPPNEGASPSSSRLPRWRGFNLTEKCVKRQGGNPPFHESDFALLNEWGFDFVRLPLSYLCWTDTNDWLKLREEDFKDIDDAVEFGRKHGVHINLNLHRAPGYCVNPPKEPVDLWTEDKALEACAFHWAHLAKRYKGISSGQVSFDLLNEPSEVPAETYFRVVKRLVGAIRVEDPGRLIIADGLRWGRDPVPGIVPLGIAQSTRGYDPMQVSHYKANWVRHADEWPEPTWPLRPGEKDEVNKETLRDERIRPWKQLEQKGVGVHVGEWGAFNHTPHKVVLAWMRDRLDLWKEAGWGWALWNLRGGFGVLDSNRADVEYEDFRGHKLDREMLKMLQSG